MQIFAEGVQTMSTFFAYISNHPTVIPSKHIERFVVWNDQI